MSKYVDGEIIELYWDSRRMEVYVKGHMPVAQARALLDKEYGNDYELGEPEPQYGRWSCEPLIEGCAQILRTYSQPGRGRFPLMAAEVLSAKQGTACAST